MKYTKFKRELFVQTFLEDVDPLYIEGVVPVVQWLGTIRRVRFENQKIIDEFFKNFSDYIIHITAAWTAEAVAQADRILSSKGAPTLTDVRAEKESRMKKLRKRAKIQDEAEYYAIKDVVDSMDIESNPALHSQLDALLLEFEENFIDESGRS